MASVSSPPLNPGTKPNFFLVGSPKCGTGALSHFLDQHPDVHIAARREPNYYSSDLDHADAATPVEYAQLFEGRSEKILGESSTWYLYSARAADRILAECGPAVQIVIVVRNPLELVASLFDYRRFFAKHQIRTLEQALQVEEDHLAAVDRGEMLADPLLIHRSVARFSDGIARYIRLFGRERVKIVFYDDVVADIGTVMEDLFAFLGVDSIGDVRTRRVNQSYARRSYWLTGWVQRQAQWIVGMMPWIPKRPRRAVLRFVDRLNRKERAAPLFPHAQRAALQAYFRADILALQDLTGRDLTHWLDQPPSEAAPATSRSAVPVSAAP